MQRFKRAVAFFNENKNKQIDVKALALEHNEFFLMIPLLAFVVSPLYHLVTDAFQIVNSPYSAFYDYTYTINYVIYLSLFVTPVAVFLYFKKAKELKISIEIKECIPLFFFGILCILIIASTCVNGFTLQALRGDSYRSESIFSFVAYFASMYFCGSLVNKEENKKLIIYIFLLSNIVINSLELIHLYIKPLRYFEYSGQDAPSAIFFQFNHYGYFLMLSIMICAGLLVLEKSSAKRIAAGVLLAANSFLLTVNTTFGCFLACLIGFIFLIFVSLVCKRKSTEFAIAGLIIFTSVSFISGLKYHSFFNELGLLFTDIKSVFGTVNESVKSIDETGVQLKNADSAGTGRWGLWRNTVILIKEKPLLGWGVEGIYDRLDKASNGLNNRPHNEYLQYAAFFGIPAAMTYISGLISHYVRAFNF